MPFAIRGDMHRSLGASLLLYLGRALVRIRTARALGLELQRIRIGWGPAAGYLTTSSSCRS
jgi:hypothetical protein